MREVGGEAEARMALTLPTPHLPHAFQFQSPMRAGQQEIYPPFSGQQEINVSLVAKTSYFNVCEPHLNFYYMFYTTTFFILNNFLF